MKAWIVRDIECNECPEIVFAETRGKAIAAVIGVDQFDDYRFTELFARRAPEIDKYYVDGKWRMDWENMDDRVALVKERGFYCDEDYFEPEECASCSAKEWCDQYKDWVAERENDNAEVH